MCRLPRIPAILAALMLLLVRTAAEEPAAATAAAEPTKLIADLRTNVPRSFSSGTWQGKVSSTATGCVVLGAKGADGKGALGQDLEQLVDLSEVKYVEVALGTGPKNEVPSVTVAFDAIDGIQYTASLRVDQLVPGQPVWLRVRLTDFKLNNWKGDKTGRTIDWKKISKWYLQGDWQTEKPCHLMFIGLRTRH